MCIAICVITACSHDNEPSVATPQSNSKTFLPVAKALLEPAPDIGKPVLIGTLFDLAEVGYEGAEYFISGTASAYTPTDKLTSDGLWRVEAGEQAAYTSRLLVYRPVNVEDFNGTVIVEWLNVTAGFDTPPEWNNSHVEMIRRGYVWVGVSAQYVGIYGREFSLIPFDLKTANPERYAALDHPGDSFSYDIYSQVAQAIRSPVGLNPLDGLTVESMLAFGQSQSASRMATYVNAFQLIYNTYDGYMIHSRGNSSAALSQSPQPDIVTPDVVSIRNDLNVPVMLFQTETDVLRRNTVNARQDDTSKIRLWEVAGTAHADYYTGIGGSNDIGDDPSAAAVVEENSILGFINCDKPMNSGPMHYVFNTAINKLARWVRTGEAPPEAPRLEVEADTSAYKFDSQGNVLGGIRTPYVDVPVAVLSGYGQSGESFCALFGTTEFFSADKLVALYGNVSNYTNAVTESANTAVTAGFLLQEDAAQIIKWAPQQWTMQSELPSAP